MAQRRAKPPVWGSNARRSVDRSVAVGAADLCRSAGLSDNAPPVAVQRQLTAADVRHPLWHGPPLRGIVGHSMTVKGLTRRWRWRCDSAGIDPATPLVERILRIRGLTDPDELSRFCDPKLTDLHEPGLLPNIDRAAERLGHAIRRRESIVIYGDYDVDGITATAILFHVIKAIDPEAQVSTYVPHRIDEGYGLNTEALLKLREAGADVVVSVDCGATAHAPAAEAKAAGIDLIITDHHNLPDSETGLPDAYAVVHPRLDGSRYPFGELCGAGVAFKLAWRLATVWCNSERVTEPLQQTLLNMLPLCALGTIADVVPLVGENRVLTSFGLRLIRQTPVIGLRALIEASDLMNDRIDSQKVGFQLAPRLNAIGRMGHAREAITLFTDAQPDDAKRIAGDLTRYNRQRQSVERRIFQQAAERAENAGMTSDDRRAIVLADPDWHPGVVGIVCSRLVDRFGRPAILMNRTDALCRGSGRSIDGYSIHRALTETAAYLSTYGGHDAAAGLTLEPTRLDPFVEAFTEHANANIAVEQLTPVVDLDCPVAFHELDVPMVKRIAALGPFGRANPRPVLQAGDVHLAEQPKQIGSQGRHLELRCAQDVNGGRRFLRCIWWGAGRHAADLAAGMRLDLAIEPKINEWNGRTSVEAEIRDVRIVPAG